MNDKEQVLLGFDLLFGVWGSAFLLAALYLRFTVGSLGYESLVYGLAAVVSVGVTLAALLLVRHRGRVGRSRSHLSKRYGRLLGGVSQFLAYYLGSLSFRRSRRDSSQLSG